MSLTLINFVQNPVIYSSDLLDYNVSGFTNKKAEQVAEW